MSNEDEKYLGVFDKEGTKKVLGYATVGLIGIGLLGLIL